MVIFLNEVIIFAFKIDFKKKQNLSYQFNL